MNESAELPRSDPSHGSSDSATIRLVIRAEIISGTPAAETPTTSAKPPLLWIAAALVGLLVVAWIIFTLYRDASPIEPTSARKPQATNDEISESTTAAPTLAQQSQVEPAVSPVVAQPTSPAPEPTPSKPPKSEAPSPLKEVTPAASQGALQTIRGTVRVTMRVTVNPQGVVVDVTPEDAGPSRYFERISREAAGQWIFSPSQSSTPRSLLLRFSFTRDGVTARAEPGL